MIYLIVGWVVIGLVIYGALYTRIQECIKDNMTGSKALLQIFCVLVTVFTWPFLVGIMFFS